MHNSHATHRSPTSLSSAISFLHNVRKILQGVKTRLLPQLSRCQFALLLQCWARLLNTNFTNNYAYSIFMIKCKLPVSSSKVATTYIDAISLSDACSGMLGWFHSKEVRKKEKEKRLSHKSTSSNIRRPIENRAADGNSRSGKIALKKYTPR